jgi:TRAP-type C4-dicarboxylate transport system substrate-binding protein
MMMKKSSGSALAWLKLAGLALAAAVSWSAHADPVKLRFASFTSDTEQTLLTVFKPFADGASKDSDGAVQIDIFPNGALGRNPAQQAQMVADGIADIAWVVPSFTPGRFPETEVFELPGLFRSLEEGTMVFTRLTAAGKIESFKDFLPIATVTTAPYSIHARVPIKTLADLKGRKIRISSSIESETLRALGAVPVGMSTTEVAEALARGTVDGTTGHPSALFDFGQVRVVSSHYFIRLGAVPITILMNRTKFNSLPKAGQDAILKYSGMWTAHQFATNITAYNEGLMKKLTSDPARTIVTPTPADADTAQAAFDKVIDTWAAKSPGNKKMLELVRAEIAAVRTGK